MDRIATHSGTVTEVREGSVTVRMQVGSACASCEAHAKCGFAESKDKEVVIDTPDWQEYHTGDPATVIIDTSQGLHAVLIAYLIPAILFLAVFTVLCCLRVGEGVTALVTLAAVVLYGCLLYRHRRHLQRHFTFRLRKD